MPGQDVPIARPLADRPGPRADRAKKHSPGDILAIALAATAAGADSWAGVERLGGAGAGWLRGPPALPDGTPGRDTVYRVLARLDPQAFGKCVADWGGGAAGLRPVAIDGRAARSAPRDTLGGCPRRVGAWAVENRLILGRAAVADGLHEAAATPELLRAPELEGALVTIAAAGCQEEIARQVRGGGGYLRAVRGSQPNLRDAVQAVPGRASEADFAGVEHDGHEAVEGTHGWPEERYATAVYGPGGRPPEWPGVAAVALAGRGRGVKGQLADTAHCRTMSRRGTAAGLANPIRRHGAVENELRGCLGAAFRGGGSETAAGHAGANLGLVRRGAAPLLRQGPGGGSAKAKRPQAGWDGDCRLRALQGFAER